MTPFDTIITQLTAMTGVAVAVERTTEIVKAAYLTIKNNMFKTKSTEISKAEKEVIALLVGIGTCGMIGFGIDVPVANEPSFVQYLIAGAIASLGSNVIHALITILVAIKNNVESAQTSATPITDGKTEEPKG